MAAPTRELGPPCNCQFACATRAVTSSGKDRKQRNRAVEVGIDDGEFVSPGAARANPTTTMRGRDSPSGLMFRTPPNQSTGPHRFAMRRAVGCTPKRRQRRRVPGPAAGQGPQRALRPPGLGRAWAGASDPQAAMARWCPRTFVRSPPAQRRVSGSAHAYSRAIGAGTSGFNAVQARSGQCGSRSSSRPSSTRSA